MLAMVAVGAMAIVFELRMPCAATLAYTGAQSSRRVRFTSIGVPRSASSSASVSNGSRPRSHFEPANDAVRPRSAASREEARMAWYAITSIVRSASATASGASNGRSRSNSASCQPMRPSPTGRWRRFDVRASGVG